MRVRLCVLLLLVLAYGSSSAFAQQETGRITGTVSDPQDRVVPGVTVTATSVGSGAVRSTVTDSDGKYVLANLQPSTYDVKFNLSGFKGVSMRLTVQVGQAVNADAKLEVGGTSETVTVTAAADIVNTANPEVATVVTSKQINELPNLERDPYSLASISGSAQDAPVEETLRNNVPRGVGVNINGGRTAGNHVLLDGANNNFEFDTTVGQHVPMDSVQEFSVITNNYSAQYGRSTSGVVNLVTKSGTNMFTGSGYEYYRTEKMAANSPNNIANGTPKGQFTRNQPGYSIGGPIAKDKAHFFSSFEALDIKSTDTIFAWVPTSQLLAASSPATQNYFKTYGNGLDPSGATTLSVADVTSLLSGDLGTSPFTSLPANMPAFAKISKVLPQDAGGGTPSKTYEFVNRVDFSMNTNNQAYVRWAYEKYDSDPGTNSANVYPGYDTAQTNRNHHLLASWTHVYSPTMTSQTKAVWSRVNNQQPVNGPPSPRVVMNPNSPIALQGYNITFPGYLPWQPSNDIPAGGPQTTIQLFHDATLLHGNHDIRYGGSYVRINDDHTFSAYSNAIEALNTSATALPSLDNLVSGQIARFQAAINPNGYPGQTFTTPVPAPSFLSHNHYNEFSFYVQDNWSLTNRFRANLGLRYDYFGPQQKSDPKYDSNFYYGDPNLDITTASTNAIIDAVRTGAPLPSNASPTGTLWKSDWNNFGPRLGFAWDVAGDGKTSVRGGYGISYERNFGNVTFNVLFNPPLYLVSTIDTGADVASQPIYTDPLGPFGGLAGVTKTVPAGSLRHVDQNIQTAYYHQYGLSLQHELGGGLVASIEYNGSTGRKLYDLADINKRGAPLVYEGPSGVAASLATLSPAFTAPSAAKTRPNPNYGAFNTRGNRGQSQYNGVVFSLESRPQPRTGLSFSAHYTLSQAKDNLSSTFSDAGNGYFNLGYLDPFNPMLDYGYAEFDVRHRLIASAVWDVPFLRDATGVKRTILGGWTLSGIFNAHSGNPFSVFDCTKGLDVCIRALAPTGGIATDATGSTPTGNPNEYTLLDISALQPLAGTYKNPLTGTSDFPTNGQWPSNMMERNLFRGPGVWDFDFSLSKRFRFGNRQAVQFRLDTFNILNHANMGVNSQNADISSFTTITGYKYGERRAQIGFRYEF